MGGGNTRRPGFFLGGRRRAKPRGVYRGPGVGFKTPRAEKQRGGANTTPKPGNRGKVGEPGKDGDGVSFRGKTKQARGNIYKQVAKPRGWVDGPTGMLRRGKGMEGIRGKRGGGDGGGRKKCRAEGRGYPFNHEMEGLPSSRASGPGPGAAPCGVMGGGDGAGPGRVTGGQKMFIDRPRCQFFSNARESGSPSSPSFSLDGRRKAKKHPKSRIQKKQTKNHRFCG